MRRWLKGAAVALVAVVPAAGYAQIPSADKMKDDQMKMDDEMKHDRMMKEDRMKKDGKMMDKDKVMKKDGKMMDKMEKK